MNKSAHDLVQQILESCGFECECVDAWGDLQSKPQVPGRRPDFLCRGPAEFWVEVKTLDEPAGLQRIARAHGWMQQSATRVRACGQAVATVADDVTQKDVKNALPLAERALRQLREDHDPPARTFVVIPQEPDYGRSVRIWVESEAGSEVLHCCRPRTGRYGRPLSAAPLRLGKPAVVVDEAGEREEVSPLELGLGDDIFRLALDLTLTDAPFRVVSTHRRGGAWESRMKQRIRNAVAEANQQLRSAAHVLPRPGLLVIVQSGLLFADNTVLLEALYGDHQVFIEREIVDETLAGNGAWNENKNRSVSAVCYLQDPSTGTTHPPVEPRVTVYNQWARRPLRRGLLGGTEYVRNIDGTIARVRV